MCNCLKLILFIYLQFIVLKEIISQNLICTNEYCDNFKDSIGCAELSLPCVIQNATYNGRIFPSATSCSCCEICIQNLAEGEYCSIGAPGSPVPNSMCGPGLYCRNNDDDDDDDDTESHPTCLPMDTTDCFRRQIAFDEAWMDGNIGNLMRRPVCDGDGHFHPIKCIPGQTCYCVDKNGNRIFGEAIHSRFTETTMRCECSRLSATFADLMQSAFPQFSARCLDDGSYDPIQCIDDRCACVNQFFGTLTDNGRIHNLTLGLGSMPCFNGNLHNDHTYLHDCENNEMRRIDELLELESEGNDIDDLEMTMCEENGWYKRVALTTESKYCVDKFGNQIGNYIVLKSSELADDMNCNCARAELLLKDNNITELPTCCNNGNYSKVDCRRGYCYCVDENGNQISREVPRNQIMTLPCYNNGIFC